MDNPAKRTDDIKKIGSDIKTLLVAVKHRDLKIQELQMEKQLQSTNAPLLTVKDLAKKLSVREGHIRQLVFRKDIPYLKVGSLVRFEPSKIEEWMRQNSNG